MKRNFKRIKSSEYLIWFAGKLAWPELVGAEASEARRIIESENPNVRVVYIRCDAPRTLDLRCDRVWLDIVIGCGGVARVCRIPVVG